MKTPSNKPWSTSREDMDSFTTNPETGETEHVVYIYTHDEDQNDRIAIFGTDPRKRAEKIVTAVNACSTITDPQQAIAAAREAIKKTLDDDMMNYKSAAHFGGYVLDDDVRQALESAYRLLQPND